MRRLRKILLGVFGLLATLALEPFQLVQIRQAAAETLKPIVRTELREDTAIPGQPLIYRVTVLVPTWMPQPPRFPSMETAGVVVRLPERASTPVSERIGGETWSGISRAYRLYPMAEGSFTIPTGAIELTYADPETRKPLTITLAVPQKTIKGQIPPAASGLDPFLAAESLKLEQTITGTPDAMAPGDALKVVTTVEVSGVSPMFVPALPAIVAEPGLALYPGSPSIAESSDRGNLRGSRTEQFTLIAENAGSYRVPARSISWFNLKTGAVETASVPEVTLAVSGPAAAPTEHKSRDWRALAATILKGGALLLLAAIVLRRAYRRIRDWARQEWMHFRQGERYGFLALSLALFRRDYFRSLQKAVIWKKALQRSGIAPATLSAAWGKFDTALASLGADRFGTRGQTRGRDGAKWRHVSGVARKVRKSKFSSSRTGRDSKLNP